LATGQWQGIQDTVTRTAATSTAAAEKVLAETKAFSELLSRTNDQEKAALKLEIDKMRRGHTEHLQVIVHTLDHIHALYQAGCRSGIPAVVEQLGQFRNACLDAARRIGLSVYEARPGDPFDPQAHQTPDGQTPPAGSTVEATIACGFTYQGQPLRRILVALQGSPVAGSGSSEMAAEVKADGGELSPGQGAV
jgi:molecular chaperone GrpE (heat shock protein)